METFIVIYGIINLMLLLLTLIFNFNLDLEEGVSLKDIFFNIPATLQIAFYECFEDRLNKAGLIIGIVFITILGLPTNLFIFVIDCIIIFLNVLFKLFCKVFAKKNNEKI